VNKQPLLERFPDITRVPHHVGIVMDGNGRWAQAHGLSRLAGHKAGTDNIRRVLQAATELGVKVLTLYAFSTENWGRPPDEVTGLMNLLGEVIRRETRDLHANGVRIRHSGRLEGIAPNLQRQIQDAVTLTSDNQRITLNVAFNYGGRAEIVRGLAAGELVITRGVQKVGDGRAVRVIEVEGEGAALSAAATPGA